jgi:hypothetical protein
MQAKQLFWPLSGTTLTCNRVRYQKHVRVLMPENGVWDTDSTKQQ